MFADPEAIGSAAAAAVTGGKARWAGTGAASAFELFHFPSAAENVLKEIFKAFSKQFGGQPASSPASALIARAKAHLELFELLKKELQRAKALAVAQRFSLHSLDELGMARMRVMLAMPGEAIEPSQAHYKINVEALPVRSLLA